MSAKRRTFRSAPAPVPQALGRRTAAATVLQPEDLSAPPDPALATATAMLMAVGLVSVYSAGIMEGEIAYDSTGHFLIRQTVAAVIGIAAMIWASRLPFAKIERVTTVFGFGTLVLLIMVLVPHVGTRIGGARRWLRLGPVSIQPSEFARLAAVLLVAKYAASHDAEIKTFRGICKSLLLPTIFCALILGEPDFGTGLMVLLIGALILFVAGIPWIYVIGGGAVGLVASIVLILVAPYRLQRIAGFMNPWADMRGKGYHIIQSWIAMGSGGLFGKGIGGSVQKLGFLPEAHTDFIFAIICEEWGYLGALFVISLFAVITWRGYRIAVAQTIPFARYLGTGITAMITLQALLNLMVATGLAPTTGMPLPLVSYGGTSLVFTTTSLGILWGLSRRVPTA